MAIREIHSVEEFERLTSTGRALVDFWAPWCGPCKIQGEILEKKVLPTLSAEKGIEIYKVDVDEVPALAARFGIQSIPTLLMMREGKITKQFVGVVTAPNLMQALS